MNFFKSLLITSGLFKLFFNKFFDLGIGYEFQIIINIDITEFFSSIINELI